MKNKIDLSNYMSLAPNHPLDLIRIGGKNDGGYVVSRSSILDSTCLLSLGISYDVNFEYDFANYADVKKPIYMYDKSTKPYSLKYLFSRILLSVKFASPNPLLAYVKFLLKLHTMLISGSILLKEHVSNTFGVKQVTFSQVLKRIPYCNEIFLKIDIEGNEYHIIDNILEHAEKFSALVIEFHEVEENLELILEFINLLSLSGMFLDHLHANNFGGLGNSGLPKVLELSFSRSKEIRSKVRKLPIDSLDSPNSPVREDFEITFKGISNKHNKLGKKRRKMSKIAQ